MNLKEVIKTINQMQADGIIERYAIGGAVGATFYLEPTSTLDVDIFVTFQSDDQLLINLSPVYKYLTARGGIIEKEYIVVADTPVQFLPPDGPLVEEALREAIERDVDGEPVRVFTAEHLAAIALQTGRSKDKMRVVQFVEEAAIDPAIFHDIILRHGLRERWEQFEEQFLGESI